MLDERTTQQDEEAEVEASESAEQAERKAEANEGEEVEAHGRQWCSPPAPESRGA